MGPVLFLACAGMGGAVFAGNLLLLSGLLVRLGPLGRGGARARP